MDKSSYMFQQRKAGIIRSMSMARVTGRKLLGVDDEDYEVEDQQRDEENWQVMLGLRVYSHDPNVSLTGEAGQHPSKHHPEEQTHDTEDKEDPEAVTATLADKKAVIMEPEEASENDLVATVKEE